MAARGSLKSPSTIRNGQHPQSRDKHPQQYSPVVRASLNPGPDCTTILPLQRNSLCKRTTPSGPKPGGVFHICLRTSVFAPPRFFVTFGPLPLSLLRSCGLAESKVRKITPIQINGLREKCDREFFRAVVGRSATENENGHGSPHDVSPAGWQSA